MNLSLVKYIFIGRILSAWGVRGQVKVEALTDDVRRFDKLARVFIDEDNLLVSRDVESVLYLKDDFVVLKLKNVDTPEQAEKLKGAYLKIPREDAVKLPEGRFFICDIIGLRVLTENGESIGIITDVLQTGANDVYVIKGENGRQILIPAVKQVVKKIDLEDGKMVIQLMEGMA
ncbi:MAG: ribosome maturation factor RimM [Tepidanaerobacteraceae bacterium]|nr:ribosome maturation factor RimM [Tepidanaerobacteraceae bacterium]